MKSATKKFVTHLLLLLAIVLPLLTATLVFTPKPVNALLCGYQFNGTVAEGGTVTITDIVGGNVGDTFSGYILTDPGLVLVGSKVFWTKTVLAGNGTITLAAPPTAGNYRVLVRDETAASDCPSNNPGHSYTLTVTAKVVGALPVSGPGSLECLPGTAKTDAEAVNMENICRIKYTIYDDKATTFNIVAGLGDGFYKMLTGNSRLYPQTNGVTAGMGALASSGTMVAALYSHPPVSGMDYLAGEFNKFNPVAPAYAAGGGIGYNALKPVQDIWESFRNIAYIGFVLVFVIIGFMIMFRAHISPQAVATVQDSLPRIVIALFLVTFSYAIAGFMIDAMFLLLNVIINALPGGDKKYVFEQSVFGAIWSSWGQIFGTVNEAVGKVITDVVKLDFLDKLLGYFGGVISALVVGIALLFVMFKVFIMLLTSYAYIIILTITAPFFFLAQALPGNNSGQTWFKQMAANIAVFPVVAIMFIFAGILGGITKLGGTADAAVQSQTVGQFPLLSGDIDPAAIGKLIAIGILLMTPSAAELIKNAIGTKGGPNMGSAAAPVLGAGAALGGFARRRVMDTGVARGIGDVMEERNRRNAGRIVQRIPERFGGTAGTAAPAAGAEDITRRKAR